MRKLLIYLLSKLDPTTAAEWRGLREAQAEKPLGHRIEFAFTITHEGREYHYHRFKDPMDMPPLRAMNHAVRLAEFETGMNRATVAWMVDKMEEVLSGKNGAIHLGKLHEIAGAMRERLSLAPFEEQMYWLAASEYFTLDETLTDFDIHEQEVKIAIWKGSLATAFFLQRPIAETLGLLQLSPEDLAKHLKMGELEIRRQTRLFQSSMPG